MEPVLCVRQTSPLLSAGHPGVSWALNKPVQIKPLWFSFLDGEFMCKIGEGGAGRKGGERSQYAHSSDMTSSDLKEAREEIGRDPAY